MSASVAGTAGVSGGDGGRVLLCIDGGAMLFEAIKIGEMLQYLRSQKIETDIRRNGLQACTKCARRWYIGCN